MKFLLVAFLGLLAITSVLFILWLVLGVIGVDEDVVWCMELVVVLGFLFWLGHTVGSFIMSLLG